MIARCGSLFNFEVLTWQEYLYLYYFFISFKERAAERKREYKNFKIEKLLTIRANNEKKQGVSEKETK